MIAKRKYKINKISEKIIKNFKNTLKFRKNQPI